MALKLKKALGTGRQVLALAAIAGLKSCLFVVDHFIECDQSYGD
jgi:hypothetical protein